MSLTYQYTSSFARHDEAYFVIADYYHKPGGGKGINTLSSGSVYNDVKSFKEGKFPIGEFNYTFRYDVSDARNNLIQQGNNALKSLVIGRQDIGTINTASVSTLIDANPNFRQGDPNLEDFLEKFKNENPNLRY